METLTKVADCGHAYHDDMPTCEHANPYTTREDCSTCADRWDASGTDASLGVGHIWTEVRCPAYRTLDPADCTCRI